MCRLYTIDQVTFCTDFKLDLSILLYSSLLQDALLSTIILLLIGIMYSLGRNCMGGEGCFPSLDFGIM